MELKLHRVSLQEQEAKRNSNYKYFSIMEIKQLEQEHLDTIVYNSWDNGESIAFYREESESSEEELLKASKGCASITIKHMKGFHTWINVWKRIELSKIPHTDSVEMRKRWVEITHKPLDDLIQLYFDSLNK